MRGKLSDLDDLICANGGGLGAIHLVLRPVHELGGPLKASVQTNFARNPVAPSNIICADLNESVGLWTARESFDSDSRGRDSWVAVEISGLDKDSSSDVGG